jgi:hypothetical protein
MGVWRITSVARVCPNGLVLPIARVDDAVLRAFAGEVLEPAVTTVLIDMVFAAMEPDTVGRSVAARAGVEALVAKLRDRQDERQALLAELVTAQAIDQIHANRPEVERKGQAQVAAWRALVETALVSDGRQFLSELLDGRLKFTAKVRKYHFVGKTVAGLLPAQPCQAFLCVLIDPDNLVSSLQPGIASARDERRDHLRATAQGREQRLKLGALLRGHAPTSRSHFAAGIETSRT